MKTKLLAALCASLLLQGCASNPPFQPAPGSKTAKLNLSQTGEVTLCTEGDLFSLAPGEEGYAPVPAGQRVTLMRHFYSQGYNVSHSCQAAINFLPEEGRSYYANFELRNERCVLLVFREAPEARVGLALEPSLSRNTACGKSAGADASPNPLPVP